METSSLAKNYAETNLGKRVVFNYKHHFMCGTVIGYNDNCLLLALDDLTGWPMSFFTYTGTLLLIPIVPCTYWHVSLDELREELDPAAVRETDHLLFVSIEQIKAVERVLSMDSKIHGHLTKEFARDKECVLSLLHVLQEAAAMYTDLSAKNISPK